MSEQAFYPVKVAGVGLCSAHDLDTLDALRAIAVAKSAVRRHPLFLGADGFRQMCAPVASCINERDTIARLSHLARTARDSLGAPGQGALHTILLLPALVGPDSPLHDAVQNALAAGHFGPPPDQVLFGGTRDAADLLQQLSQSLHNAELADCLLVCADTRISPYILDYMEASGHAPVRSNRYAPLPGEMGVALHLQSGASAVPGQDRILTDLRLAQELDAPTEPMRGLMGLQSVPILRAMGDVPEGSKLLVDTDGPRHKSEEIGVILTSAITVEDDDLIAPSASIGMVGCATVPMFISVAVGLMHDGAPGTLGWISPADGARIALRVE